MRSRTWRPSRAVLEGLFFLGAPKLLRILDYLIRRPWLWWRDELLPLVYLVTEPEKASPLIGIEDRLRHGMRVVYSRIDRRNYRDEPVETEVSELLNSIVADLSYRRPWMRRIRFPHYSLAFWLQALNMPERGKDDQLDDLIDDELQKFIRRRYRWTNVATEQTGDLVNEFPWYVRLSISLLPQLGMVIMRMAWRPPRWLVKHTIGERHGRSFKMLSQAFMTRTYGDQDEYAITQVEVDALLVDSFLEDIRRSYRRWTFFGTGRRRSTYPVLLVDNATFGTPNLRLLELISRSRDRACARTRRRPDPYRAEQLLIVARGDEAGLNALRRDVIADGVEIFSVADIQSAFRDWRDRIDSLAHNRSWFLPLEVSVTAGRPGDSSVAGLDPRIARQLHEVERRIHNANGEVEKLPNHLTVVYLNILSSSEPEYYYLMLEQLRGIAVGQNESKRDKPVRIILANAGEGMEYGRLAAEEIVAEAENDRSVVAVIGMGTSREGTRQAMVILGERELPMVGAVISATELATTTTRYYYQVSPTNKREAEVVAARAEQLGVRTANVYYFGDQKDFFSNDLKDQVVRELGNRRIEVDEKPYLINFVDGSASEVSLLGRDACGIPEDGIAFYAGRAEHLSGFLNGMKNACEGSYPKVIAGDSVGRFVRAGGLSHFPGLDLEYISFASSLAWGSDCLTARSKVAFFVGYADMFGDECFLARDGNAILAYDTLLVVTQAARNAIDSRPSREAVWAGIRDISGDRALRGASGVIDFPRTGDAQSVPQDKAVLILRTTADNEPERVLLCGRIDDITHSDDTTQSPDGCR